MQIQIIESYFNKIVTSPVFDYLKPTPVDRLVNLSKQTNNDIYLKREDLQDINSFKIRGAYQKIISLPLIQLNRGVVAASAGNHAQGVAKVCKELGTTATIVMPDTTPKIKVDAVRSYGANVVLHGVNYDEAYRYAYNLADSRDLSLIHPFDDIEVICGQGTIGLEFASQVEQLDYLFVQVGGGGLLAGLTIAMNTLSPSTKIIAVEPEGAQTLGVSLRAKVISKLDSICSFSDGVAVGQIGKLPYEICKDAIDDHMTVSKDEVCSAIQYIHEDTRAIAEGSGAVGLAGAYKYLKDHHIKGKKIGVILSGSNMNFQKLEYVAQRCNLGQKKEKLVYLTIPEKQGELIKLVDQLSEVDITELKYRKSASEQANIMVSFSSVDDTSLVNSTLDLLRENGYKALDMTDSDVGKSHLRFMIGDSNLTTSKKSEKFYRFEFPEKKGQLLIILQHIYSNVDFTAINYRKDGSSFCSLLLGIEANYKPCVQEFLEKYSCTISDVTLPQSEFVD
ncbi:threonine dehydratase [Moritella sp. PE36]|uniref:threonine ammonia-lyase, biosynthetic n=1 Tax=Moritella sp. PE36 TaxID=58051 RepID=UPI00015687F7|nr:threonine ammonia-lyase, biosynthetic [Moritella sp. PE36]EDM68426.1 threonine dehydratase [Moritella sp. PE36]